MEIKPNKRFGALVIAGITLVLIIATWMTHRLNLDLRLSNLFFSPETGWYLKYQQPWHWLNRYGTYPGRVLVLAAIFGLGRSFFCALHFKYRRHFLLIVLTALLGSGIIVNGLLKPLWGRPRPLDTAPFEGPTPYHAVFQPGSPGKGYSFPCGHSSMGYLFICLWVFRKKQPWLGYGGLLFGLAYGSTVALARMVEGAHFMSDSLWSWGLITIVCLSLYYWGIPPLERAIFRTRGSRDFGQ